MKASRNWGSCNCDCGQSIKNGDDIDIVDGLMYLQGHFNDRRTRTMKALTDDVIAEYEASQGK